MKFELDKYTPVGNQVLLEIVTKAKSDTGLIIYAEEKEEKFLTVVKTGNKCENVKPGDLVLLGPTNVSITLAYKGKTYKQVPEYSILGFMKQTNAT